MGNYNTAMEIMAGMSNSAVHRLKKSKAGVPAAVQEDFDKICSDLSPEKSYKAFRELMSRADPPCIPYLGVYLTDLTFIDDGNKDRIEGGNVNILKCKLLADAIKKIQMFQQSQYNFLKVQELFHLLENGRSLDDSELYKLSLRVEPRESS